MSDEAGIAVSAPVQSEAAPRSAVAPLGCLLLHGLTSSLETVSGLAPQMEARGLPYRLPTLRGHGTVAEDLRGVSWHHWYEDAERALDDLLTECERAVVIGLSMGALLALHLAAERQAAVAGVVAIAPAIRPFIPAAALLPLLARTRIAAPLDARRAFEDPDCAAGCTNYTSAPLSAVYSLVRYGAVVERRLPAVAAQLLVLYTPRDRVVRPEGARLVYEAAGTPPAEKRLLALGECGHEMLLDRQRDEVIAAIGAFVDGLREGAAPPVAVASAGRAAGLQGDGQG